MLVRIWEFLFVIGFLVMLSLLIIFRDFFGTIRDSVLVGGKEDVKVWKLWMEVIKIKILVNIECLRCVRCYSRLFIFNFYFYRYIFVVFMELKYDGLEVWKSGCGYFSMVLFWFIVLSKFLDFIFRIGEKVF